LNQIADSIKYGSFFLNFEEFVLKLKSIILVILGALVSGVNAQQTTNQALQECMNKVTAQSAAAGALVGGLLGAILGGDGKRNQQVLILR